MALLQEVVRTVTDVDTIKALADPTRLAILRALSRDRVPKSAKELAEDLDQPQTKLYRHLKVLQEAGLIEAAETRVVSGIVETKYRAAQSSVTIDPSRVPGRDRARRCYDIIAREPERLPRPDAPLRRPRRTPVRGRGVGEEARAW